MTLIIKEMLLPDQITALLENRIDVGYIGFRNLDLQDILNYETILKSEIFVILPSGHRLLKNRRLDLAELSREKFIFVERQSSPLGYDWLMSIPKVGGFTPQVVQKADTPRNLFSLIAAGVGISLVPEFLKIYALPGVAFRPLKQKVQLEWSMAWRKDNKSPVLETFLFLLRDELKNRR
jgi:DNA-binding transcriptional LysR family regulator